MRLLITGGCGFIGHHIVEAIIKNTDWEIVIIDKLSYASNGFDRLRDISVFDDKRITIFAHDFTQPILDGLFDEIGQVDYILHVGAETSVDKSILDPKPFVMANVVGTLEMLEFAREQDKLQAFLYFSTDEIFGPAPESAYKEWDRYNSTNPYSASKAGGEELCLSWANSFSVPIIITHTMNAFGERQHPEKFIPSTIRKVLNGETVIIHSDATKTVPGSRFYIHARNIADAVLFLLRDQNIRFRDKFNIVGEKELDNLELAQFIASVLGKELKYELVDFHSSRPGHDLRYALDGTKMRDLGWKLPVNFEQSLSRTIVWFVNNQKWLGG